MLKETIFIMCFVLGMFAAGLVCSNILEIMMVTALHPAQQVENPATFFHSPKPSN